MKFFRIITEFDEDRKMPTNKQTIVINADDYGLNSDTTSAIASLFKDGLLDRTTMIVTFLANNEQSIRIAKKMGFLKKVGLHINLNDGEPLTEAIKTISCFCKNGVFNPVYRQGIKRFFLKRKEKKALFDEIAAQFDLFKELTGTDCSFHFDSHHHVHTDPSVWRVVKKVALQKGFVSTRLSQNVFKPNHRVGLAKRFYKVLFNSDVRRHFRTSDYFCSVEDYALNPRFECLTGNIELMCHPRFEPAGHCLMVNSVEVERIMKIKANE